MLVVTTGTNEQPFDRLVGAAATLSATTNNHLRGQANWPVLLLVLLYGLALVIRRRWISRDGGTFEFVVPWTERYLSWATPAVRNRTLQVWESFPRPADFRGWKVPEILLSGNHAEVERWRSELRERSTTWVHGTSLLT